MKFKKVLGSAVLGALVLSGCSNDDSNESPSKLDSSNIPVPASKFDLSKWKITIPTDKDNDGKVDEVSVKDIQTFQHPDYFFLDDDGNMVFATPNKAFTTPNSSNTRSELHQMLGGENDHVYSPANNFTVKSHKLADQFAQIGGNLQATLKVNHVAERAKYTEKYPAYSVVVGQIHATKDQALIDAGEGYGYGNEPIKIYYKKWPDHEYGSVFWNYERNLPKKDPNRTDIAYPIWGHTWDSAENPGNKGIALNEEFSYEINVYEDTMYLTFTAAGHETVNYEINLTNNIDAYGNVDEFDHPHGYVGDANFFKAGAYNQCSTKDDPGFWYAACPGIGDWETDKKNGDYAQVTFTRLVTGPAKEPK